MLGPLNLGYTPILGNYVLAWVLALIYVRASSARHDGLAAPRSKNMRLVSRL